MDKKSMTATAALSDSASARTDQLPVNPKQPLETLADQISTDNVATFNVFGNPDIQHSQAQIIGDSGRQ